MYLAQHDKVSDLSINGLGMCLSFALPLTAADVCGATGMTPEDVIEYVCIAVAACPSHAVSTLRDLDYLHTGDDGTAVLDVDFAAVHAHAARLARSLNKKIDPAALRWTPPI